MRTLSFSTLALVAASGVACSSVVAPDGGHTGSGPSPAPSSTTSPPSGTPAAPPSCALHLGGAVVLDVPDATASATLDDSPELGLSCGFTGGDNTYVLYLTLLDVDGPAAYTADLVTLERSCLQDSCPGDYSFAAVAWEPPTCSVTLDTFAPATRGGMVGTLSCPHLPIDDFEDPEDTQAVTIQGTFAFPPPGAGEVADAGPGSGGADAGPPTCTMTVGAPFDTGTIAGEGDAVSGVAECAASASGVTFALAAPIGATSPGGELVASGASFCSADCEETYVPTTPCEVHVLEDEGVGGRFVAQVACQGMTVAGMSAEPISVVANIDGIHEPPPPPQ